jgi:type I restriction enzyme S subunit
MSDWPQVPFSSLLKESVRNGIYKPKEFHGRGAKIVNMGELFGYPRLRAIDMKRIELSMSEIDRFSLAVGDLIFARRSLTAEGAGKCSVVLELDGDTTFESSIIRARPNEKFADSLFLYYFFSSSLGAHQLDTIRRQVAVAGITGSDLSQLLVPAPPLSEQQGIASVLSALDDKIELNRRMNETLEAMARAIFKDWFVDFGPTRAKMEGRAPYLAPDIWSLFPDRLDDEGKPQDWTTSTIGQEVEVVGGSTPSTKEAAFWGGNISWATPKDLSSLSTPVLLSTERQITEAGLTQIGSGLLPAGTVLLSSRAPIGYMAIAQIPVAVNQGFIAMICKKRLSNVFVWLWTQANMETVHQNANGSTFQEISKANFRPIEVTVATPELLRAFDETSRPLFDRIVANEQENRTLAATRDFLLPKLMSGEVRVKDAEKLVGEAA